MMDKSSMKMIFVFLDYWLNLAVIHFALGSVVRGLFFRARFMVSIVSQIPQLINVESPIVFILQIDSDRSTVIGE
jgi:hypothetical protein